MSDRNGKSAPKAGAEGPVDVRLVDRHGGDAPVLALQLVLEGDEVAETYLLLGTPPAPHERKHERLGARHLRERELLARRLG
jgi:hypothetical protein